MKKFKIIQATLRHSILIVKLARAYTFQLDTYVHTRLIVLLLQQAACTGRPVQTDRRGEIDGEREHIDVSTKTVSSPVQLITNATLCTPASLTMTSTAYVTTNPPVAMEIVFYNNS